MAGYRPIYKHLWNDPDFIELEPINKLLFLYLCTNEAITTSGIYQITPKKISDETGIPYESVKKQLLNSFYKNITYDTVNNVVFVKKLHKYSPGGRPDLIKKSILTDYKLTSKSSLWNEFVKEYKEYKEIINSYATVVKPFIKDTYTYTNKDKDKNKDNLSTLEKEENDGNMDEHFRKFVGAYEKGIGKLLNPNEIELLKELADEFPVSWFEEAIEKAKGYGASNLKYISKILYGKIDKTITSRDNHNKQEEAHYRDLTETQELKEYIAKHKNDNVR